MFNGSNNLKGYRFIVAVVLMTMLVSACVSKSRYEQAQSDLAETQRQVQRLSDEKLVFQSKFEKIQSDYEDLRSRNDTLQSEVDTGNKTIGTLDMELKNSQDAVDTAQSEIDSLLIEVAEVSCQSEAFQANINDARLYLDILDHLNTDFPEDVTDEGMQLWFFELTDLVYSVEDPDLEIEFENMLKSNDLSSVENSLENFYSYILHKLRTILEVDISCPGLPAKRPVENAKN